MNTNGLTQALATTFYGDYMISVVVPIYKVEEYLRQCVESILNQTYKDLEIILVDDGSPDNCPSICDEYALKDARVKVIHKENGGLIAARKTGVMASTGEYVTFVDGDDYISKYMYEEVAKAIESYSPDMVMTEFFWSYERKDIPSERTLFKDFYNREAIERDIIPIMLFNGTYYQFGVYPNCWTKIFRKELLEKYIYDVDERVRMGEDAAFTYACIMDSPGIATVKKPLYYYRNLETSMSNAYDSSLIDIWSIPYEAIKMYSELLKVNIENQLCYYLLYLINFVIRNEAKNLNNSKSKDTVITAVFDYKFFDDIKTVDKSLLPVHTKLLFSALNLRSKSLVKAYIKLFSAIKGV